MPLLVAKQLSEEWFAAHINRITSSTAAAVLGLDPYRGPLAAYRSIVARKPHKDNWYTSWGTDNEARARTAYEVATGNLVQTTGFWVHHEHDWLGASPDGLIDADGMLELKCPQQVHEFIPIQYEIQMAVQMIVTGRKWCDFFSWTPSATFLERRTLSDHAAKTWVTDLHNWWRTYVFQKVEPPRSRNAAAAKPYPFPVADDARPSGIAGIQADLAAMGVTCVDELDASFRTDNFLPDLPSD
jgi:putative phage-type endonuclease